MGIDYRGVGGIGIEVTEQMIDEAFERKFGYNCEEDEDEELTTEDKLNNLLFDSSLEYETAGNAYSGEITLYLLVSGSTLGEVQENVPVFLEGILQVFDIKKDPADLEVISDLLVY